MAYGIEINGSKLTEFNDVKSRINVGTATNQNFNHGGIENGLWQYYPIATQDEYNRINSKENTKQPHYIIRPNGNNQFNISKDGNTSGKFISFKQLNFSGSYGIESDKLKSTQNSQFIRFDSKLRCRYSRGTVVSTSSLGSKIRYCSIDVNAPGCNYDNPPLIFFKNASDNPNIIFPGFLVHKGGSNFTQYLYCVDDVYLYVFKDTERTKPLPSYGISVENGNTTIYTQEDKPLSKLSSLAIQSLSTNSDPKILNLGDREPEFNNLAFRMDFSASLTTISASATFDIGTKYLKDTKIVVNTFSVFGGLLTLIDQNKGVFVCWNQKTVDSKTITGLYQYHWNQMPKNYDYVHGDGIERFLVESYQRDQNIFLTPSQDYNQTVKVSLINVEDY